MNTLLGTIIGGSLSQGVTMRIAPNTSIEQLKAGKFVSIHTNNCTYFSLIVDIALAVTNPDIMQFPPNPDDHLLTQILIKHDVYATAQLKPMLVLEGNNIHPVKTIPLHFAPVHETTALEIAKIFGDEHDKSKKYFNIGSPLDMDAPVCIDLERLTERSNGIFGKTGTGKTFLTRLVLAGLIKKDKAVNLIFDMHSEYGIQARQEGGPQFVKGLKTLFPDKVVICSLDPAATRRRGVHPDIELVLPFNAITGEDILSLSQELHLNPSAIEVIHLIEAIYKTSWLSTLLHAGDKIKEFAHEIGGHPESVASLYRKLKRLLRVPFLNPKSPVNNHELPLITQMMEYLHKGKHVIVEFGNFTDTFTYLLIANMLSRRIHAAYIDRTERFLASQNPADEPRKLMITIEEAHKFLNPHTARQTIFGIIAREMRKYYVSLLIVDQRPSDIDQEILSQIGTKIIAALHDERDVQAVLTGVSYSNHLRTVLAGLSSKQQALLLGHAVPMPVVVHTRSYDSAFYSSLMEPIHHKSITELVHEIF